MTPVAAFAQQPESAGRGAVHSVPFASEGNAIELEIAVPSGGALGSVELAVVAAPAWLRFDADAVVASTAGRGVPVGRFVFDVDRLAPAGELAEVTFEVRSADVTVAFHTLQLQVSPPPLALDLPYPNPTRGGATVPFTLSKAGHVRLAAYDVLGREIAVLVDGERTVGAHEGRLDRAALAPGVYIVRLVAEGETGRESQVQRLTVVR